MKIYIVSEHWPYESPDILLVATDKEAAIARAKKDAIGRHSGTSFRVDEYEENVNCNEVGPQRIIVVPGQPTNPKKRPRKY